MAKKWTVEASASQVRMLYNRVLNRDPDSGGLITYGSNLNRGELSVRDVVRILGKSDEYKKRFILHIDSETAAEHMYWHFLARGPENIHVKEEKSNLIERNWKRAVDSFIDSSEYRNRFGIDKVPQ